ncbi:transposase, partial [Xanthomonas fragariae]|uniref:transposase n=1 Tax=Xanthomonas fragariae TaxID=48664 RepID=UPI00131EEBB0
ARERCQSNLTQVQSLLCDSGYTGVPFAEGVREILGEQLTVQIAKRSELHTFKVMPKRWIVERSFAWLEKNRRLWKNCERKLNTSLQFIHLAFLALLLKRS